MMNINQMDSTEIIIICEIQGIEYISFTQDSCNDFHITLWENKVTKHPFNLGERKFDVEISHEDLLKVFAHFGINKPLFSCAKYPIVENPTPVYFSQITGRIVQIGDVQK